MGISAKTREDLLSILSNAYETVYEGNVILLNYKDNADELSEINYLTQLVKADFNYSAINEYNSMIMKLERDDKNSAWEDLLGMKATLTEAVAEVISNATSEMFDCVVIHDIEMTEYWSDIIVKAMDIANRIARS